MPLEKERLASYFGVKKLYQKSWIQVAIWAWITAQKSEGILLKDAARSFVEYFGIQEDIDWRSLSTHYYYIHKLFQEEYQKDDLSNIKSMIENDQMPTDT